MSDRVEQAFDAVDLALFAPASGATGTGPIRTYQGSDGTTLSAISDRNFLRWILSSVGNLEGRHVFEIGTGTGYLAAVLAGAVGSTADRLLVHGCEIIPELFDHSCRVLGHVNGVELAFGDWVEHLPSHAPYDVVIATSAFRGLPASLRVALGRPNAALALPIAVPGGGDCFTIFRTTEGGLSVSEARLSVSVPTTGKMADHRTWNTPLSELFGPSQSLTRIEHRWPFSHPVLGTLGLRSLLFATEARYCAVGFPGWDRSDPRGYGFGLFDDATRSGAFFHVDGIYVAGSNGLRLASELIDSFRQWDITGRNDMSSIRYVLPWGAHDGFVLPSGFAVSL